MIGNAVISTNINIIQSTTTGTAGSIVENILNGNQPLYAFANGTLTNQCDTAWSYSGTLTSTSITFNLQTLENITGSISFARVKFMMLQNMATTDGFDLTVGGAGSNPWTGYMSGAEIVPAGGLVLRVAPLLTDWIVGSGSNRLEINSGSNTVAFKLILLGSSI